MTRVSLAAVVGTLLCVAAKIATADVIAEPPEECPRYSAPGRGHGLPLCSPNLCIVGDAGSRCTETEACAERRLCISDLRCSGWLPPGECTTPNVTAGCREDGTCDVGVCQTLRVCVPNTENGGAGGVGGEGGIGGAGGNNAAGEVHPGGSSAGGSNSAGANSGGTSVAGARTADGVQTGGTHADGVQTGGTHAGGVQTGGTNTGKSGGLANAAGAAAMGGIAAVSGGGPSDAATSAVGGLVPSAGAGADAAQTGRTGLDLDDNAGCGCRALGGHAQSPLGVLMVIVAISCGRLKRDRRPATTLAHRQGASSQGTHCR